jgi:bacteriorhodopsin
MSNSKSIKLFSARPRSSAVLAVLLLIMGLVFFSGLVPTSPNHKYFPGHEWFMAIACWALAMFFSYCAAKGRKPKRQEREK